MDIINSSLEYDQNGDLLSSLSESPSSTHNYSYNYNSYGRVESIGNGSTELASYQYDPMGKRISKTIDDVTTYFLYDILNSGLAGEYDQQGELIRSYSYRPDSKAPIPVYLKTPSSSQSTGESAEFDFSFYQNDHIGTPQQLIQTSGATVWQAEYDVFGKVDETINIVDQPLRFIGQYHDRETDLYYNCFRYYSPDLGRYVSSDPIGLGGGLNTFGYAYQNPQFYFDANGLFCLSSTTISTISGATGGAASGFISTGTPLGAAIGGVSGGVSGYNNAVNANNPGQNLAGNIGIGTVNGTLSDAAHGNASAGGLIGGALGTIGSAFLGPVTGNAAAGVLGDLGGDLAGQVIDAARGKGAISIFGGVKGAVANFIGGGVSSLTKSLLNPFECKECDPEPFTGFPNLPFNIKPDSFLGGIINVGGIIYHSQ